MRFLLLMLLLAVPRYWGAHFAQSTAAAKAEAQAAAQAEAKAVQAAQPAKLLAPDLWPPVALQAGGKAIDVEIGHAAPCVADLGDGKLSLLVGQFGGGKLRAYTLQKNGDGYTPGEFTWVKAGTAECSVPSG